MLAILLFCLPALLIRYVIVKKPLGLWVSIGFAFAVLVLATAANEALANASILKIGQGPISASVVITFFILYKKKKNENQVTGEADEFYYYDGHSTVGPYEMGKMLELYSSATIHSQTPVIRKGEADWKSLGAYCDLNSMSAQIERGLPKGV